MQSRKRSFLFLQGVCSPFFAKLDDHLKDEGHSVHKINFNTGDMVYWLPRKAHLFRERLEYLPELMCQMWTDYGITDQILFGDKRAVHDPHDFRQNILTLAQRPKNRLRNTRAEDFGVRTHVFEEGYFRPYWVTLERDGVNNHSSLPKDPQWYQKVAKQLPDNPQQQEFKSPFVVRAFHDVAYNVSGLANPILFPHYRRHAPDPIWLEYAGYIKRFVLLPQWKKADNVCINELLQSKARYYFLPLQLNGDAQIIHHSEFKNMLEVIDFVSASFAKHAPQSTKLVIKNHPLDMGLVNYRKVITDLEQRYDLSRRIVYLESGDLGQLLEHAIGTITVNSTVGAVSLEMNRPTIALDEPIYHIPGLTFQGQLDDFWLNPATPDAKLFHCFKKTVIHTTQINGGFYCQSGINLAVANAAKVLTADKTPLEQLL